MNNCEHKNKAYSNSFTDYNGTYTPWICKDCGLESNDFVVYHFDNEYEATKQKFNKTGSVTSNPAVK